MTKQSALLSPSYYSDCAIFARVARTLSYQYAGDQLGLSRSTISKRIVALEQALGVILLNRSTRRISLTDAGTNLLAHWTDIERAAHASFDSVHGSDLEPSGRLRISIATSLGAVLMPCLARDFLHDWPDLQMSIHFSEPFVDVVGHGFDVVIRIAENLSDSVLVAKRLATSRKVLVASPGYLERHGKPSNLKSLKKFRALDLHAASERGSAWRFVDANDKLKDTTLVPACVANNDLALILAACLDVGILYTPKLLVESELSRGHLQVIELDDAKGPEVGIYALYPHREPPAKVRVFVDFVSKQLSDIGQLDRWNPLLNLTT